MSWYKRAMPTVKDLASVIHGVCGEIKAISGVQSVYVWGSYIEQQSQPDYAVKDVDVIACTEFDSGDLLAIDNSRYSALRIKPADLEDEGFNPKAVNFTKKFLSFEQYNVDHWATSSDGKLLHWGAIPDNQDEWRELHIEAEKRARADTGLDRACLPAASEAERKGWKSAYDSYIKKFLASSTTGWYPSDHPVDEILATAKKFA
jgi:hypothetical protein